MKNKMKKEMKKLATVMMTAALLFGVAGCGNNEKVIDENPQSGGADATQSTGEQSGGEDAVQSTGGQSGQSSNNVGYTFSFNGTTVEVDADVVPILDALGSDYSYYEAASCAFEGLDKMYTYSSFQIDTYPSGDKDCVSAIILKDDSVSTAEGVSIGDSKEKLEQTYGSGSEECNIIKYENGGMQLLFIIQDDVIMSIEYRSMVLASTGQTQCD